MVYFNLYDVHNSISTWLIGRNMVDETQRWILFALLTSSASAFHQSRIVSPASLRKWQRCRTTLFEEAFKKGKRGWEVKYVKWAGLNGLLPLQRNTNVMEKEAYNDWLCKQLPLVLETFTEDTTMLDSIHHVTITLNLKVWKMKDSMKFHYTSTKKIMISTFNSYSKFNG